MEKTKQPSVSELLLKWVSLSDAIDEKLLELLRKFRNEVYIDGRLLQDILVLQKQRTGVTRELIAAVEGSRKDRKQGEV